MRAFRRISFLSLLLFLILSIAVPAFASLDYQITPLKTNYWYALKDLSHDMTVYQIKVTTPTAVIFNWKDYDSSNDFGFGSVYRDRDCNDMVDLFTILGIDSESSGTRGIVLYPGTYYIEMYDGSARAQVKITTKTAKKINKTNYSLSRATSLKAGKKAEFAQTRSDNYHRWYNIRLTSPQTVSFYGEISNFEFYDSNLNEIRCNRRDGHYSTDGIQSPGTYYLEMMDYNFSLLKAGSYYSFYWK